MAKFIDVQRRIELAGISLAKTVTKQVSYKGNRIVVYSEGSGWGIDEPNISVGTDFKSAEEAIAYAKEVIDDHEEE